MKNVLGAIVFMLFALTLDIPAQSNHEVLTNAKIIEMVRSGFSERLILEKIRQSQCKCDTTMEGMQKLKAAKVSEEIIMAMMEATRSFSDSVPPKAGKEKDNDTGGPKNSSGNAESAGPKELRQISEPGIYLFEDGKMTGIEAAVFSGSNTSLLKSSMTMGIKKAKFKAKVRGRSANLKATSSQPVFYFVFNPDFKNSGATMAGLWGLATSPNEFLLVQMDIQENSRQAVLGEMRAFTGSIDMGARDKDIREFSFEKIKAGIYKVVPKASLAQGEYAFYYAGNITGIGFAGGKVFDFGIK